MNTPAFDRVLVANRGEIARRIFAACRELGLGTVAVYSEADLESPHVHEADAAVAIGKAPARESYLDIERIIAAARASGAGAIHPGYGFLAENAELARAAERAGLVFIGPRPQMMDALGNKVAARAHAEAAGVPVVPGVVSAPGESLKDSSQRALDRIGVPLLVKAAAGGGGKGMRVVRDAGALEHAVSEASREALSAFGDGTIYFERYLERPRHIEVQIVGDVHGNVVHLGERECSVQRRHQKLIEETPAPALDEGLRDRIGQAAVLLGRRVGYIGAGTVEFLVEGGHFYFIEVNTRLQVEHTVTELVRGVDLVKEQIHVARGGELTVMPPPAARGHAIQCRITAEDPYGGFAPSTGRVLAHRPPRLPGVRVDANLDEHGEISVYYDPMFAKVIAWGRDRSEAIARLRAALARYLVVGIETSIPFHLEMLAHPDFVAGHTDIKMVERWWPPSARPAPSPEAIALAAVLATAPAPVRGQAAGTSATPMAAEEPRRAWKRAGRSGQGGGWR